MSRPSHPNITSPIRLTKRSHVHQVSFELAKSSSSLTNANTSSEAFSTLFSLLSQADPTSAMGKRIVTPQSFSQFLNTMRIITTAETVTDAIRATVMASENSDTPVSLRSVPLNSDDLSLSEQQTYSLLNLLPNTVSILLDRCELLAEMAEHPLVAAKLQDEIRNKERISSVLEEDQAALVIKMAAIQKQCEALEAVTNTTGSAESRTERFGSPTLRSAQVEQRQRLSALTEQATKAAESLDLLLSKHQTATEEIQRRELEAAAAEDALREADIKLREHTTSMFEIEQRYLEAKKTLDAAQDIQRELSREKQRRQEVLTNVTALAQEAAALEMSLRRSIEATDAELHNNLKIEIRDTQKIVRDLEAAAFVPSQKDRELVAARSEFESLKEQLATVGSRLDEIKADLQHLYSDRKQLEQVSERHISWVTAPATSKGGKSYEDNLLLSEIKRAIDRQFLDVEERRFSERRAQRLTDFYRDRQAL